jgi:hypothetical protein
VAQRDAGTASATGAASIAAKVAASEQPADRRDRGTADAARQRRRRPAEAQPATNSGSCAKNANGTAFMPLNSTAP